MATIMVVDDYPVTQRMLTYQLYKKGYSVVTASNGREALDTLDGLSVDLMIVDLVMPTMDGLTMLRHLRADDRYEGIPVVMLTSSGKDHDRSLAMAEGVDAFITKPTSSWQLTDLVGGLLKERVAA